MWAALTGIAIECSMDPFGDIQNLDSSLLSHGPCDLVERGVDGVTT